MTYKCYEPKFCMKNISCLWTLSVNFEKIFLGMGIMLKLSVSNFTYVCMLSLDDNVQTTPKATESRLGT